MDRKRIWLQGVVHPDTLTDKRAARKRFGRKMRHTTGWGVLVTLGFVTLTTGARAAIHEQIGSWVLDCPGDKPHPDPCVMRAKKRLFEKAGITGDLEVQGQGGSLIPVITLRGLSAEMLMAASAAGHAEASIQLPGGPRENLDCAVSPIGYICAPNTVAGRRLSARLAEAQSVTVTVFISSAGFAPLPAREQTLDLADTSAALARLRVLGPSQVPDPASRLAPQSPGRITAMADAALKAAGYKNGLADVQAFVAKYIKTRQ